MNVNELSNKIFMNKRTGMIPSFPVAFKDERGKRGLTWFYYFKEREMDKTRMTVGELAVADEKLNDRIDDVDWQFDLEQAEKASAEISLAEFYTLMGELFEAVDFNEEAIWELLLRAVSEEMAKVYREVVNYAVEHLKDVAETDMESDRDVDQDQAQNREVLYDQLVQGAKFPK